MNDRDGLCHSALHYAVSSDRSDIVRMLDPGSVVDAKDALGHGDALPLLLNHGASLASVDHPRSTPLHLAASDHPRYHWHSQDGCLTLIPLLLSNGQRGTHAVSTW